MAIRRQNGEEIDYPHTDTKLEQGDRLLVVGSDDELAALNEFALGRAAVPTDNSACQWITLNNDCPVLGKRLEDLEILQKLAVQVQAIRRDGKFIRSPDRQTSLQARDQLLLCGSLQSLEQLENFLVPKTEQSPSFPTTIKAGEE
jgi:CPA2 family monovalent cation:H+ antiporter-2